MSLFPAPLKLGDTIGVIAPSSYYDVSKLDDAVSFLEQAGFRVQFHSQTKKKHYQFAGTDEEKIDALHNYFKDPSINAIFCTCGGNGAIHLLDKIDYSLIQKNPKIFQGFSDITVLLHAIYKKTGLITFHGPTLTRLSKITETDTQQMLDTLTGQSHSIPFEGHDMEGTLFGGNLSMMQSLIGTDHAPDLNGAILFLEDVGDHLSRYDRMLGHMQQAGWFQNLSGILVGQFLKSQDSAERPFGLTIEEIFEKNTPEIPKIFNAPIGHGERLVTLPIGAKASLKNGVLSFKSFA